MFFLLAIRLTVKGTDFVALVTIVAVVANVANVLMIQCRYGGQHNPDYSCFSLLDAVNEYSSSNSYMVTHTPGISELNTFTFRGECCTKLASSPMAAFVAIEAWVISR